MVRTRKCRRFSPRLNLTVCLLLYCFLGAIYLTTFSTQNQTVQIKKKNYKQDAEVKFSVNVTQHQVSKKVRFNFPTAARQTELFVINQSAEKAFYDHPRDSFFPIQGALKNPQPLFKMGEIEINSDLIIGIPTVSRKKQNYLFQTLHSLLKAQQVEGTTVHIVVLIAETNLNYVKEVSKKIHGTFKTYIQFGRLQVISPPVNYYPSWRYTIKAGFNDSFDRVKWRSKQNLDQIFLMMYIYQHSPTYYLMMEDDVIAMKGYLKKILEEAKNRSSTEYFFLSFCSLGAIGKLFQTPTLPSLASFVHLFWNKKPLDWLLIDYATVTYCGFDDTPGRCNLRRNTKLPFVNPALFQHVGIYSSLDGKIQVLFEESFEILQNVRNANFNDTKNAFDKHRNLQKRHHNS